jgi:hypothetical protein
LRWIAADSDGIFLSGTYLNDPASGPAFAIERKVDAQYPSGPTQAKRSAAILRKYAVITQPGITSGENSTFLKFIRGFPYSPLRRQA